jgi:type I restriction-modification system specificity subunit
MKVKLGDICDIQSGGTPSRSKKSYWANGTIPWVKISDIRDKYIDVVDEYITEEGLQNSSAKIFPKGTLLYTIFATLGEAGILSMPACTNQAIVGIQPCTNDVDVAFLYYQMLSKRENICRMGRGVAQNNINLTILRNIDIELPSLVEQGRIVATLECLDNIVRLHEQQLKKLDLLVRARFVELFGDPVLNPMGWGKYRLAELGDIRIGPFGSILHREDYVKHGNPLVNPSHILEGAIQPDMAFTLTHEKYRELSAYHLHIGDIVMGRRGEMGRCAVVQQEGLLCGTGSLFIRITRDILPDFIQSVLSFPTFKAFINFVSVGQTMQNINAAIVSEFMIITPPIEIQQKYFTFVSHIESLKSPIRASLSELQTLKKSLMQAYFA